MMDYILRGPPGTAGRVEAGWAEGGSLPALNRRICMATTPSKAFPFTFTQTEPGN
jgi:hypothetical protein